MRKVLAQPLALLMSMIMLVALAVCGVGLKTAHHAPAQPFRGTVPARHIISAPAGGLYSAAIGTAMLVAAVRLRDTLALAAGIILAQHESAATEEHSAQPAGEKVLAAAMLACEMLAWLALCARTCEQDVRRRFAAFQQNDVRPSPLSRLTAHRIAPAP